MRVLRPLTNVCGQAPFGHDSNEELAKQLGIFKVRALAAVSRVLLHGDSPILSSRRCHPACCLLADLAFAELR